MWKLDAKRWQIYVKVSVCWLWAAVPSSRKEPHWAHLIAALQLHYRSELIKKYCDVMLILQCLSYRSELIKNILARSDSACYCSPDLHYRNRIHDKVDDNWGKAFATKSLRFNFWEQFMHGSKNDDGRKQLKSCPKQCRANFAVGQKWNNASDTKHCKVKATPSLPLCEATGSNPQAKLT